MCCDDDDDDDDDDDICIATQDKYQTVAEALQAAVASLLKDESMRYKTSFYYWAAFITHGFASIKLDDALLDKIHERLEAQQKQKQKQKQKQQKQKQKQKQKQQKQQQQQRQPDDDGKANDIKGDLTAAVLTLTRDAYHRLEEREETLSREWCDKWGVQASD